jgi:hypothetical protein
VYVGTLVQQQLQLTPQKTRQQQKPKQQQQQQQQEQQPEEQQGQTSMAQQSAAPQDGAVTDEDQDPELQQQLQRQVSKVSTALKQLPAAVHVCCLPMVIWAALHRALSTWLKASRARKLIKDRYLFLDSRTLPKSVPCDSSPIPSPHLAPTPTRTKNLSQQCASTLLCLLPQLPAPQISSLSGKVQQLERELRQERKEGRKMDTLKEQLAASKAEAQ